MDNVITETKRKNSEARLKANAKYNKKAYERTTITMKPEEMKKFTKHCEEFGYSKNGFMVLAIKEKIERDENKIENEVKNHYDDIAKKVGFESGRQCELAIFIVKKIDELKNNDKNEEATKLTALLNQKPNSKEDCLKKLEEFNLNDEIDDIKNALLEFHFFNE